MAKYKDKYRIESTRLPTWDYRNAEYYFITILTKNRKHYFGKVVDGKLIHSKINNIVIEEWMNTALLRSNIELDEWVLMPNHFHGIMIKNSQENLNTNDDNKSILKSNSLGSIIGQFKSISTKRIRKSGLVEFSWQPGFYEHIIRNEQALENIRKYIRLNPLKWAIDEYNKD
ncbi:MAG TPA: transposase [Ignavibacteriales bacterium]|nr:transposase [Ignavibacteriales bacterium]